MSSPVKEHRQAGMGDAGLFLLAVTALMLILDVTITNVALPTLQTALDMTPQDLQWVVNAYSLIFGGFLLLGGRLADRLGRRRIMSIGLAIFAVASLAGGFAETGPMLVAARGMQGLGAALASPASLSIVTASYPEGPLRNRALGVMSAVMAAGGALGLLAGGLLTEHASWRWVMWVNVPISVVVLAGSPRLIPELAGDRTGKIDVAGAVTATGGLVSLVYGAAKAAEHGWNSLETLFVFFSAAVLLGSFLLIEKRHHEPLVPLSFFTHRGPVAADVVALAGGGALIASPIFFLTLYLQQIQDLSAIQAGLAILPMATMVIIFSKAAPKLVENLGVRRVLVSGLVTASAGLIWLSRIDVDSSYLIDVLPPIVLVGIGMGLTFVPLIAGAVSGVPQDDQGLATGLLNTAQQTGVALGLAILTTAASQMTAAFSNPDTPRALTAGYATGILGAGLLAALAALVAVAATPTPRAESSPDKAMT